MGIGNRIRLLLLAGLGLAYVFSVLAVSKGSAVAPRAAAFSRLAYPPDLWVDAEHGDDGNDGLSAATALRTLQRAADLAGPGTTIHILPGIYRESIRPARDGSAGAPTIYRAENGSGTVAVRGSKPSDSLVWTPLQADSIGLPPGVDPAQIYSADLSAWDLDAAPRFIVLLGGGDGEVTRLPLAREPDWQVATEWKHHEFWWAAEGGSQAAGCDPARVADCDADSRSRTQLTDRTNDLAPSGVEPGNLTTLGDLTGATLVAIDTKQGHNVYRRTIVAHDVAQGRVTVDEACKLGSGGSGLGWGSKYYVEGAPYLLDTPGEWWYDSDTGRLYLWPLTSGNPATTKIEISHHENGFVLRDRSHIVVDGLTLEFFNGNAIYQANNGTDKSHYNTVRDATLRYANRGVWLTQLVRADEPADNVTVGFTLEDSEIGYMDTHAIRLLYWWENGAAADSFIRSGIVDTVIRRNKMHHLGFRSDYDNANGATFQFADRLRFEGNHVHHVAHNGMQFLKSVIQSPNPYGFTPDEIKTGEILIKDNVFEKACQLTTDCGALKIWGDPPDNHVHRDLLIVGNVFRNTLGWTDVAEKRGRWKGGPTSEIHGMGGFGLYVDMASGIHAYRNIAYNNAYAGFMFTGVWRDGDIVYYNNLAANNLYGFDLGGRGFDTHGSLNTRVFNNILVNNEGYGIVQADADGVYSHTSFDHNLYFNNGWRAYADGGLWQGGAMAVFRGGNNDYYPTLGDIRSATGWEMHGAAGDPAFAAYDVTDHDLHDGSWPDFHLTADSGLALDRGTTGLPASLEALLNSFGVEDVRLGDAFDIGRYERGFEVRVTPPAQAIGPGGVAHYLLSLYPADWSEPAILSVGPAPPDLTLSLSADQILPGTATTLTVRDEAPAMGPGPGVWYTLSVTATSGGTAVAVPVPLLVGGARVYLPLMLHER